MKERLLIVLFCFAALLSSRASTSGCDGAGNCYVRSGASGSGNGSSWTNAYNGFGNNAGQINPSSMSRGTTYWVAAGSYGSPNFSTADSGTAVITVQAATTSSHGPASDWSSSYAGQVIFGADTSISSDYWTFNGQAWPCTDSVIACGTTGYNVYFHNTTDGSTTGAALILSGGTPANPQTGIILTYVEVQGINNGKSDDVGLEVQCSTSNFYLGYSYVHDVGVDLFSNQYTCSGQNYSGTGYIHEHDFYAHNHRGDSAAHAQAIATGAQDLVVRYSEFYDITSSGGITDPFPGVVTLQNWAIYGNVFYWDTGETAGVGDGMVGLFGENMTGTVYIVNNTLAYVNNADCPNGVCNSPALFLCGKSGCGSGGSATGYIENNLWWNPDQGQGEMLDSGSAWNPTVDYNQCYCPSGGCSYSGLFTTQGSHDLQTNTGNPFVNFDGVSNFNVALVADTSAGVAVTNWHTEPSWGCTPGKNCMDIDGFGVTRSANGTIDRGALQIGSALNPPTNLSAAVH